MVKLLRWVLDFLLYSNLFIALGAVALVLSNQLTIQGYIVFDKNCWFVLFATTLVYSALKFVSHDSSVNKTAHQVWAERHPQLFRNVVLIAAIGSGAFFLKMSNEAKVLIVLLAVFTAFYGGFWLPIRGKKPKLRELGLVKTMFVGMVWSFITVLVPFANADLSTDMLVFLLLRRFLFIFALTVPFEIKDMEVDRASGIRTLPLAIGVRQTKLLAQGILLLLLLVNVVQYAYFSIPFEDMAAFNLSLIVSMICIQPVRETTSNKWYFLVLDGMMFVQFLFVFVAYRWLL